MGMVPADDREMSQAAVHFLVNLGPGLMGEGHLGEFAGGRLAANGFRNRDKRASLVPAPGADQDAANFDGLAFLGVLPQFGMQLGREVDAEWLALAARKRGRRKF